jgi:hypothetical protein
VFFKPIGYRLCFISAAARSHSCHLSLDPNLEMLHTLGGLGGFLFLERQEQKTN